MVNLVIRTASIDDSYALVVVIATDNVCCFTCLTFLPFSSLLSHPTRPFPYLVRLPAPLLPTRPRTPSPVKKQPRATASPVDIPFADDMNDSFDIQDGGGTHVIIRDVKMTIGDQEVVLNQSDSFTVDPISGSRIPSAKIQKKPYMEERHPKFRVIDSNHN